MEHTAPASCGRPAVPTRQHTTAVGCTHAVHTCHECRHTPFLPLPPHPPPRVAPPRVQPDPMFPSVTTAAAAQIKKFNQLFVHRHGGVVPSAARINMCHQRRQLPRDQHIVREAPLPPPAPLSPGKPKHQHQPHARPTASAFPSPAVTLLRLHQPWAVPWPWQLARNVRYYHQRGKHAGTHLGHGNTGAVGPPLGHGHVEVRALAGGGGGQEGAGAGGRSGLLRMHALVACMYTCMCARVLHPCDS